RGGLRRGRRRGHCRGHGGGRRRMKPRIGVITFPGTCDDRDALRAIGLIGGEPVALWHADDSLDGCTGVIVPGGFSYGDYLRAGAIARFAPMMREVEAFAAA